MINHWRPNWLVYEKDIVELGGSVNYCDVFRAKSKRSCVQKAIVTLPGSVFETYMERFRDGTAAIVSVKGGGSELWERYNALIVLEKHENFHGYVFLRFVKQFWLAILQIVLSIFCICFFNQSFMQHRFSAIMIEIISFTMLLLCGKLYSRIRCSSFDKYCRDVEIADAQAGSRD